MNRRYCEVALPVPLRSTFTYAIPDSLRDEDLVGRRLLVPFRNRAMVGVGLSVSDKAPTVAQIKEISGLLDRVPALPPKLIELGHWISRYYVAPVGETFRAMLPPEIELRHDREYWLTDAGRVLFARTLAASTEHTDVESSEFEFLCRFDAATEKAGRHPVRGRSTIARGRICSLKDSFVEVTSLRGKWSTAAKHAHKKSSPGIPQKMSPPRIQPSGKIREVLTGRLVVRFR